MNCFDVSRDVIVLTGVSGQLGVQYSKALLDAGARVVGLDLYCGAAVDDLIAAFPNSFLYCDVDITSEENLRQALSATRDAFGEPTVLVNNAAIDSPPSAPAEENGPFESYPRASWERVLNVNVTGTYLPCQVFGAAMAEAGYGSIINVSSIYGVVSPDQNIYEYRRARGETFYKPVAYSVSKSAILNLTRYLAVYWAKRGVRVNTLVIAGVERGQDADFLAAYNARIPIGRMARETDYNGPLLFLASRASEYMTGSELVIDGGWTAI